MESVAWQLAVESRACQRRATPTQKRADESGAAHGSTWPQVGACARPRILIAGSEPRRRGCPATRRLEGTRTRAHQGEHVRHTSARLYSRECALGQSCSHVCRRRHHATVAARRRLSLRADRDRITPSDKESLSTTSRMPADGARASRSHAHNGRWDQARGSHKRMRR